MHFKFRKPTWFAVLLGFALTFSISACMPGSEDPAQPTETSQADTSENESADTNKPEAQPEADSNTPDTPKESEKSGEKAKETTDATTCQDSQFAGPAKIPAPLKDSAAPFYPCTHEMAAVDGSDPLFVGEYVTSHELTIVNMFYEDQFNDSQWNVTNKFVEGSQTVTEAAKSGYSLVVVVAPNRIDESETSIHYTLRQQ